MILTNTNKTRSFYLKFQYQNLKDWLFYFQKVWYAICKIRANVIVLYLFETLLTI